MSTNRPFPVDPALTALAIGFRNQPGTRIADEVLPRQPVSGERFKWTRFPTVEAFSVPETRVSRRGQVQQIVFSGTEETSQVEDFGLEVPIPYTDIDSAAAARAQGINAYDPEQNSVRMLNEAIMNAREARAAQVVFNFATYAAARRVTLSGTAQFNDLVNSDPISVLKTATDAHFVQPYNTMVMGWDVWSFLSRHPRVVNAVRGNVVNSGLVSREEFLNLFRGEGINRLLIGAGLINTARPGQTPVLTRAWGKHISLIYQDPAVVPEMGGITFGMTAQFGGPEVMRYDDPKIGLKGGVMIRQGERVKELIVAPDAGYMIQNAVA